MSELRFDGRVAVITGAGRGLGRAYALLLASRGAKVVVNDPGVSLKGEGNDAGPAQSVVDEIKAAGGMAIANTDSVATPEGGKAIIQAAIDHFGRIDILIHNAGIVRRGSLKEMSNKDFDDVLDVHLRGAFYVVRNAFPLMCAARYGRIVLTSSIAGLYGGRNTVNYSMAKSSMVGLCNVAAIEGADEGVKCNVILPGAVTRMSDGVDTSQFPPMEPEMAAPLTCWLAHESCTLSGEILSSMAGRNARVYVAESQGVYQPSWTLEQVAEQMNAIRDTSQQVVLPVVPQGQFAHIGYCIEMARRGAPKR